MMEIKIKRIYEPADETDGLRILCDRLWPRGISKEKAKIDLWAKEIAPTNDLRKWFGHDPDKWDEFRRRYREEIQSGGAEDFLNEIKTALADRPVTLLYAAKDEAHNNAVVLAEWLQDNL